MLIDDFEILLRESLPPVAADILMDALNAANVNQSKVCTNESQLADVSIRINPTKLVEASELFPNMEPVGWCKDAFFLKERQQFTLDPLFHAGAYYVQDSSSMFPELLQNKIKEAIRAGNGAVLDLCASPGGKSTHLISMLSRLQTKEEGEKYSEIEPLIVCNEVVIRRVPPLCDNIAKWGAANVVVTNTSAAHLGSLTGLFDVILADVPCSGEGMFRKSADAVSLWSRKGVDECAALQRSIISDIWPSLRSGGLLIYSTCTYNHIENGDNVRFIAEELGAELISLEDDIITPEGGSIKNWLEKNGVLCLSHGYQFVPGLVRGEGQFFAVLRKRSANSGISSLSVDATKTVQSRKTFIPKSVRKKQINSNRSACQRVNGAAEIACKTHTSVGVMYYGNPDMNFFFEKSSGTIYMLPENKELRTKMLNIVAVLSEANPQAYKTVREGRDGGIGSTVKMLGVRVGTVKAGKIVPDADFALSSYLAMCSQDKNQWAICADLQDVKTLQRTKFELSFACVHIDRDTALSFLSKDNITPQPDWPRGYILLKYRSLGLGFINNLGTRCNNLYPLMRRILKIPPKTYNPKQEASPASDLTI